MGFHFGFCTQKVMSASYSWRSWLYIYYEKHVIYTCLRRKLTFCKANPLFFFFNSTFVVCSWWKIIAVVSHIQKEWVNPPKKAKEKKKGGAGELCFLEKEFRGIKPQVCYSSSCSSRRDCYGHILYCSKFQIGHIFCFSKLLCKNAINYVYVKRVL